MKTIKDIIIMLRHCHVCCLNSCLLPMRNLTEIIRTSLVDKFISCVSVFGAITCKNTLMRVKYCENSLIYPSVFAQGD